MKKYTKEELNNLIKQCQKLLASEQLDYEPVQTIACNLGYLNALTDYEIYKSTDQSVLEDVEINVGSIKEELEELI